MKLTEYLLAEMDREVDRSRQALEQVPAGKYDWKPHEKSMIFGYLVNMVATIPSGLPCKSRKTIWMLLLQMAEKWSRNG